MKNITIKINAETEISATIFDNNVCVVNTTPHPINMQNTDGELVTVPCSGILLNAKAVEKQVNSLLVKTEFVGTEEGKQSISAIETAFHSLCKDETLIIVGSIIAAQAYPGKVFGLTPVPGYERVAPAEKRMRCDKFTTF